MKQTCMIEFQKNRHNTEMQFFLAPVKSIHDIKMDTHYNHTQRNDCEKCTSNNNYTLWLKKC